METCKSILDDISKVCTSCGRKEKDHGEVFPCYLNKSIDSGSPVVERALVVVSTCSRCDAPIYGPSSISSGEVPPIKHTCNCRPRGDSLKGQVRTT